MKLIDYIRQTINNRSKMILLKCGKYNKNSPTSDTNRLNKICGHRYKKWNLTLICSPIDNSINNCLNFLPREFVGERHTLSTIPVYDTEKSAFTLHVPTRESTNQIGTCRITGLLYWSRPTERTHTVQVLINRGRVRGFSLYIVAHFYLWEWPEGNFKDIDPNAENGTAQDVNGVGEYHRQPRPWAHVSFKQLKVYGIELETLAPNSDIRVEMANRARQLGMLAERDGSLAPLGLEIIAKPMSYEELIHEKSPWKIWMQEAVRYGMKSWYALNAEGVPGGYGMHVNMNRRHFDPLHLEKFIVLVNNETKLSRQIAGRSSRQYALLAPKILGESMPPETDKYQAVALRGSARAEVRIFRGTLRWEGFVRNLEFVDSLVEYTRRCGNKQLSTDDFLKWLHANEGYNNLKSFLPLELKERYKLEI